MPTILTLFKNVLRKLTPAEVDQNFENLQITADAAAAALGGYTASQAPGVNQIPVVGINKHLMLPGGIKFPAVQIASTAPNTLDDYEEGTWTPTLVGETTAGTANYSMQAGTYTKVGRMVRINCRIQWTGHTGTGNFRITGLPFVNVTASALSAWASGLLIGAGKQFSAYAASGLSIITMVAIDPAGGNVSAIAVDPAGDIFITGTYEV